MTMTSRDDAYEAFKVATRPLAWQDLTWPMLAGMMQMLVYVTMGVALITWLVYHALRLLGLVPDFYTVLLASLVLLLPSGGVWAWRWARRQALLMRAQQHMMPVVQGVSLPQGLRLGAVSAELQSLYFSAKVSERDLRAECAALLGELPQGPKIPWWDMRLKPYNARLVWLEHHLSRPRDGLRQRVHEHNTLVALVDGGLLEAAPA